MRCSCKVCGPNVWMVQADSDRLGCVCTVCGYRCSDCLGTDTVVPRDQIAALANNPRFSPERWSGLFQDPRDDDAPDDDFPDWSGFERDGGF